MARSRFTWASLLCLAGILLDAWLVYKPGLSGSFLFDDFGNLPSLGETGPIDNAAAFWRYVTSGHADPTGRPLAMLSFLLDARDWPASPFPFKRTNILLHLLNGVLLTALLRWLGISLSKNTPHKNLHTEWAALIGAGLWLLHPLFVSTTLYVVQREAMLAASFSLLGLLAWLYGRALLAKDRLLAGSAWLILGLGGCTLLATLCKANGILLPMLALSLEYSVFQRSQTLRQSEPYRHLLTWLGWLPACAVFAYLLYAAIQGWHQGLPAIRPWTLTQRLLTEPRVLLDYLNLLWVPHPYTSGVFNDQIAASTSLWHPLSTFPALFACVGLLATGFLLRRSHPAFAAAVLFYFAGQSLESSSVPLELYYEHRNYLPAMLMFWPITLWLTNTTAKLRIIRAILCVTLLAGLSIITHAASSLWGNQQDQALLWAQLNPSSPRAQTYAAQLETARGQPAEAIARLRPLLRQYPDELQISVSLFDAECALGAVSPATFAATTNALKTTRDPGTLLVDWLSLKITNPDPSNCPQLNAAAVQRLLTAARENPLLTDNSSRLQDLHYLQGLASLHANLAPQALAQFDVALATQVRPAQALEQAALLGNAGFPALGIEHLDYYQTLTDRYQAPFGMPRLHQWVLARQSYWSNEISHLRATLRAAIKNN